MGEEEESDLFMGRTSRVTLETVQSYNRRESTRAVDGVEARGNHCRLPPTIHRWRNIVGGGVRNFLVEQVS